MKKLTVVLGLVLVLQIVGSLAMYLNSQGSLGDDDSGFFLDLNAGQMDKIIIQEKDSVSTLLKQDGKWMLPALKGLPADPTKVKALLGKLANLQGGWPVATTGSSHERFEVSEHRHQRRLQLYQAEQLRADVYIGTSPGFRKVHARNAESESVYAVKLNTFDMPTNGDDWLDKNLLSVTDITGIGVEGYRWVMGSKGWQIENGDGLAPDTEVMQKLISALENLKVLGISDEGVADDAMVVSIELGDQTFDYHFWSKAGQFLLSRDDFTQVFALSEFEFEAMTGLIRQSMRGKSEAETQDSLAK